MKKITVLAIILLVVSVGLLSGCTEQSDEDKLIGTWIHSQTVEGKTVTASFTFHPDKTVEIVGSYDGEEQTLSGVWKIIDSELVMVSSEGDTTTSEYSFSNNDKTLTIIDYSTGTHVSLTKQ